MVSLRAVFITKRMACGVRAVGLVLTVTARSTFLFAQARKHFQSKRSELSKVSSLPRVSRNSIMQEYLIDRKNKIADKLKMDVRVKNKYMNYRAIAVERNPQMFARARGRLRWHAEGDDDDGRNIVHPGDELALGEYIKANKEELIAEAMDAARFNTKVALFSEHARASACTHASLATTWARA